jgi:hypothetical protein
VEELEELNQALRNRDKIKGDAIAQLSDQLLAISILIIPNRYWLSAFVIISFTFFTRSSSVIGFLIKYIII